MSQRKFYYIRKIITGTGNLRMNEQESEKSGSVFLNAKENKNSLVAIVRQHPGVWTHIISFTPKGITLSQRL